jgi:predicted ATPase
VRIVLDHCEPVLEGVGELVDCLIQRCPGIRLILTSREPLGTPGELVWRVPSLDQAGAVDLFLDRAVLARPGFVADKDMLPVIAQIAERLDGLPLALELAAARTRVRHPARIVEALDDRFRLLTGGNRVAVGRQQTLEASVAWSYELLDEPERAVLRCLAVFRGGFTLEAAEAVASDGERVQPYDVLDLLARLIDKSMATTPSLDGVVVALIVQSATRTSPAWPSAMHKASVERSVWRCWPASEANSSFRSN